MPRPRTKRHLLVENAACLDVTPLLRAGWLTPGHVTGGISPVAHHPTGTPAGAVRLRADLRDDARPAVQVSFALRHGHMVNQTIALTWLPRVPFGGRRWLFLCPQTGARACRLYLPRGGERFLSREAHGLRYAVEHATREASDIDRVCRLYRRMAGHPAPNGALSRLPPRPKGMHQHTYDALACQFMITQSRLLTRLTAELDALRAL